MGTSVDGEIVLWNGTTEDSLKRLTGSGVVTAASGVASALGGTGLVKLATNVVSALGGTGIVQLVSGTASALTGTGLAYLNANTPAVLGGSGPVRLTAGVPSIAALPTLPWLSGRYYDASHSLPCTGWTGGALTALRCYATPFYVPNDVTISDVGVDVTTLVNPSTMRYAIYSMGTDNKPGSPLWQVPSAADTSTAGVKNTSSLSVALAGGTWYYSVVASDAAIGIHQNGQPNIDSQGFDSHTDVSRWGSWFLTLANLTSALPTPFGTPTGKVTTIVRVSMLVA